MRAQRREKHEQEHEQELQLELELELELELGKVFILLAKISGEILGFSFDDWHALNARINEWCEYLNWSRKRVAEEWETIWWQAASSEPQKASTLLKKLLNQPSSPAIQ
jgi:hypothetical protein